MTAQDLEFFLLIAMALLIAISLYAAWLRLNLWIVNQTIRRLSVIQPIANGHDEPQSSGSGVSPLLLLAAILIVIGMLLSMN